MKLSHIILYVDNVPKTMALWQQAFGLDIAFLHEEQIYGEFETGNSTLAIANIAFGKSHFEDDVTRASFEREPGCFEICLETETLRNDYERAVTAGMIPVRPPFTQPWGQLIAWLRDPNGILIELSSPPDSH